MVIAGLRGRHLFFLDLVVIALSIVGAMLLRFDTLRFADEALIYFPAALWPLIVRPPVNVAWRAVLARMGVCEHRRAGADLRRRRRRLDRRRGRLLRPSRPARCRRDGDGVRSLPALVLRARRAVDACRDGRPPLPDPRVERVEGLAPGQRRPRRRRRLRPGPDPRLWRGRRRRDGPAHDRRGEGRSRDAGRRRPRRRSRQAEPGPARDQGPRQPRRAARDRPGDRRAAVAHRHPDGLGRRGSPGRGGRDSARARDTHRPSARRARLGAAGRRRDPRGRGHRPAATRPGGHRRTRIACVRGRADRPRHRRRRLDRLGAVASALRARPGATRPARSRRRPALRHRT